MQGYDLCIDFQIISARRETLLLLGYRLADTG